MTENKIFRIYGCFNKQVPNICKYFANNLSFDVKLLKNDSKLSSQVNFLVNVLDHN